jgi:hypothetical protein
MPKLFISPRNNPFFLQSYTTARRRYTQTRTFKSTTSAIEYSSAASIGAVVATLPTINFLSRDADFNTQAYSALKYHQGFVLTNIGSDFSGVTGELITSFETFLRQPAEKKAKYVGKGSLSELTGFFPYGMFYAGSKCCNRFWINVDSKGAIAQELPDAVMRQTSMELFKYTQQIVAKTAVALQIGLGLQQDEFTKVFRDHEILTVVDSYLPLTQEKLIEWLALQQLAKTPDGKIVGFIAHKDLMPLSILIYGNNQNNGLEVNNADEKGRKSFKPVLLEQGNPYNIQAVVMSGMMMENLTDNTLQGAEHRVVMEPIGYGNFFRRQLISSFVQLNLKHNAELKPIRLSADGPHFQPTQTSTFFAEKGRRYEEMAREQAAHNLSDAEIKAFPAEDDIVTIPTQSGPMYRRK